MWAFAPRRYVMDIIVKKPSRQELEDTGVQSWPVWEKEESTFDWYYDDRETCYFLEGDVEVSLPDGTAVSMGKGDLVVFPEGLRCTWYIKKKVRKHYNFG